VGQPFQWQSSCLAVINRWLAFLGLAIALVLLVASGSVPFIYLLIPLWIFLVSMDVLINSLREGSEPSATPQGT
jgi:fatty acid desaturase